MVYRMERNLSREAFQAEKYAAMDKLKIGIVGISPGAGVSFFTSCLARYLTNTRKHNPAVIELGGGSLYDACGMDKRFAGRQWFCFYDAVARGRSIRGIRNMDEGINWILKTPEETQIRLPFEQKLLLTAHARGDIILCDFSGEEEPNEQLLRSMDQIIAVIDPMPSKMLAGHKSLSTIKTLETEQGTVIYLINKMNRGVHRRQLLDYLKIPKHFILPLVKTETVYAAEYNCRIPYAVSEIKAVLQEPMGEIASALLGNVMYL